MSMDNIIKAALVTAIVLVLAAMLIASVCRQKVTPTSPATTSTSRLAGSLIVHHFEGHIYLSLGGHSSLLHSQSCTNQACVPVTLEQLRNPLNFITPASGDPWNFQHLSTKLPDSIGEAAQANTTTLTP